MDIQDEIKARADKAIEVSKDALYSHAWTYPLQGIYYLFTHKSVQREIKSQLLPRLILSIGVIIAMFTFAYIPQAMLMSLYSGPFGFVSAVPLILTESNLIISALSVFMGDKMDLIFDTVLLDHNLDDLVSQGREVSKGGGVKRALKAKLHSPLSRFSVDALIRYIITIPLNLIPAVGTILFIVLNGRRAGPRFLSRYFQLKRLTDAQKEREIDARTGSFTAFGTMTVVLSMIPVVNQVFGYTNTIGAALMATEMEKRNK